MNPSKRIFTIVSSILFLASQGMAHRREETKTPGYNQLIPPSIMTAWPDEVRRPRLALLSSSMGCLASQDGQRRYNQLSSCEVRQPGPDAGRRGLSRLSCFVPLASIEGLRRGMVGLGVEKANQILLYDGLMDSNSLFLTGNTDTVYAIGMLDLERDGPTVVEIPAGAGPGTVNDAYFRFVTDMGAPGPDRGKGGKYLLLPPGYKGEVPEGYFVSESPTYVNWLPLRGFLKDGKPDDAVKMWTEGLKIYPLADAANPPELEVISGTGKVMNTIHANDYSFFAEIDEVIQREPVGALDPRAPGKPGGDRDPEGPTLQARCPHEGDPDRRGGHRECDGSVACVPSAIRDDLVLRTRRKLVLGL